MADRPHACAAIARRLQEPLPGTAPQAVGWLLVEDTGPWGHDALDNGTLPEAVVAHLRGALADHPIRYQAIRRPDRSRRATRRVFLVHSGGTPWARALDLPVEDLVAVEPTVTLDPVPPDVGLPHPEPIVLVCTHGRRDACCAERGRPVAQALAVAEPDAVWETSHTGGHRFAAACIMLPSGLVHGFMDARQALDAIVAIRAGQVSLDGLRGRSSASPAAQAAEVWLRVDQGLLGIRDVLVEEEVREGDVALVRLRSPHGMVTLRVARRDLPERPKSCGAAPARPESWQVVDRVR